MVPLHAKCKQTTISNLLPISRLRQVFQVDVKLNLINVLCKNIDKTCSQSYVRNVELQIIQT